MKALTILQPWASLIAVGAKRIETRSWPTKYRGEIAIHAGKKFISPWACEIPQGMSELAISIIWPGSKSLSLYDNWSELPRGSVIAIAELVNCIKMDSELICFWRETYGSDEIAFGHYEPGRYAWMLANVRRIEPVPARGMQRLWIWEGDFTCLTQK